MFPFSAGQYGESGIRPRRYLHSDESRYFEKLGTHGQRLYSTKVVSDIMRTAIDRADTSHDFDLKH